MSEILGPVERVCSGGGGGGGSSGRWGSGGGGAVPVAMARILLVSPGRA